MAGGDTKKFIYCRGWYEETIWPSWGLVRPSASCLYLELGKGDGPTITHCKRDKRNGGAFYITRFQNPQQDGCGRLRGTSYLYHHYFEGPALESNEPVKRLFSRKKFTIKRGNFSQTIVMPKGYSHVPCAMYHSKW